MTSAEESTTDVIKTIEKRNSLPSINNNNDDEMAQQTTMGLNSLLIQVGGGLLKNFFNQNGIDTQSLDSAVNLFSVDKVKQDLVLFRRGLNLVARFAVFLNKYLPSPSSSSSNDSIPLRFLSSKVRFYSTDPGNYQWLDSNNEESDVPPHIQDIVDFTVQDQDNSTSEPSNEIAGGSENTENVSVTERPEITGSTPSSASSTSTEAPAAVTNSNTKRESISAQTGLPSQIQGNLNRPIVIPQSNNYGLPQVNNYGVPQLNNYGYPQLNNYGPPQFNGLPVVPWLYNNNNGYSGPYPGPYPVPYPGLYPGPYPGPYPAFYPGPGQEVIKTSLELPNTGNSIPFSQNTFNPTASPLEPKKNYGSIADLPLQYPTFSDKASGQLHDSFGSPVSN